jgi:signal recognition particle subunit SRP54
MFESLSEKLQRSFKTLRGQGTLTPENIDDALRDIRLALLDADVNLTVADTLIAAIRTRALGTAVATALSPAEQIVKIVSDELINTLGKDTARFKFASQPPTVILMAGLQGSGKTTTSGKLAAWLKKGGHRPLLVSVDVYRPAARQQLKVVAESIGAKLYEGTLATQQLATGELATGKLATDELATDGLATGELATGGLATGELATGSSQLAAGSQTQASNLASRLSPLTPGTPDVLRLAKEALREARNAACDILIVDTAGRLGLDEALMAEMSELKKLLNPTEILFVADAMTGQDAVNSAKAFHDRLAITGTILTKMDGDSRGGAALSIREITGQPIKFLGTGEKPDAFEPFHPDRIVGRILGMGDIATLLERAEEKLDKSKASAFASKALSGEGFSLEDFREQLRQIKKLGSMQSIMKMMPSVGPFAGLQQAASAVDEKQFTRIEVIIDSMTKKERQNSAIINGSRRKRIALGAGVQVSEVNNLLKQHAQMSKMFKTMGSGGSKMQQRLMSQMGGGQRFGR